MRKNGFYLAWLVYLFSSCSADRALQTEKPLLNNPAEGKWWIINSVARDAGGNDIHYCALLGTDTASGKNHAVCFVSVWTAYDSAFYYGMQNTAQSRGNSKSQLPFKLDMPGSDSTSFEWEFSLKRNKLRLQTEIKKDNSKVAIMNISDASFSFDPQRPFSLLKIMTSPGIWTNNPLASDIKLTGKLQSVSSGKLFLRVIAGRETLLEKARQGFVHWLDLVMNTGEQLSVLFNTDNSGMMKVDAVIMYDANGSSILRPAVQLRTLQTGQTTDKAFKKNYPLNYSVDLPGNKMKLVLRPRIIKQEIPANKSSFWMGAVELINSETGQQQGRGNMYIFRQ